MIIEIIKDTYINVISEPLTPEDIDNIINGLKSFNAYNWQDNGGSIWDWGEEDNYSEHIKHDIENLQTLRKLMDKYKLDVYFYDSY